MRHLFKVLRNMTSNENKNNKLSFKFARNMNSNDEHKSSVISLQSILGVHCSCYDLKTVSDSNNRFNHCCDIPLGCQIARWDISNKKRIKTFTLHSQVISCIQSYFNTVTESWIIATCSYDRMLKIWDSDYNLLCECLASDNGPVARIHWSLDGKQLLTCTKQNDSTYNDSIICLWRLNTKSNNYSLELLSKIIGNYRYAMFNKNMQIILFNTQPNIIELLSAHQMLFITAATFAKKYEWCCAISMNNSQTRIICATTNKAIYMIDACTLSVMNYIQNKEFSPNIWCILWSNENEDEIIFSPKNGEIQIWNMMNGECQWKVPSPFDFIYVLKYSLVKDFIWIATSEAIYHQRLKIQSSSKVQLERINDSRQKLQFHSITCCGIDFSFFNQKSEYIAVGDLACNLFIWKISDFNACPILKQPCVMSVRSIKWIPNTNFIFIGCLDGSLCLYTIDMKSIDTQSAMIENTCMPLILYDCRSAINCIQYKYQYRDTCKLADVKDVSIDDVIVAVGTTQGYIFVFKLYVNADNYCVKLIVEYLAHPPVDTSHDEKLKEKFGSLHKAADIWTCVWSPNNGNYLATASEDQKTKIWNVKKDFSLEKVLSGHSTAVTSVDWSFMSDKSEVFATCADDRKIMIWKPIYSDVECICDWQLLHTFSPQNILGWFTFTYLRLQRDGCYLGCGTENGYVCVFDVLQMKQIECKCMHRGSVEGLECNSDGCLVSIASDCTIVVQQMN